MSKAAAQLRERYPRFPSAIEALFLVIALVAIEHLVAATLRDVRALAVVDPRDINAVVVLLGNGILFTLLLGYKRMTYGSLFHASNSSVGATIGLLALPILLTIPGTELAVSALVGIIEWLFPLSRAEQAMFDRMMSNDLATIVSVCVLAPILEEMLFRGIILRSFLLQYTRKRAFIYSSLVFGAAHLNIYQFTAAFLVGLVLAWVYERTRSLWPCILLHAAGNSFITWRWFASLASDDAGVQTSIAYSIVTIVLAVVGFSIMRRVLAAR